MPSLRDQAQRADLPEGWHVYGVKYELKEIWDSELEAFDRSRDWTEKGWQTKIRRGKHNLWGVYAA